MMKHYSGVGLETYLPFMHSPRQRNTGLLHRVYRFENVSCPQMPHGSRGTWNYTLGNSDALKLTVSKPVMLHGVQHFGSEGGEYTASLEVKGVANGFSLVKLRGTYSSKKDETNGYYGYDVMFDHPVCLEQGKTYEIIVSLTKGQPSWRVIDSKNSYEVEGIQFTFSKSASSVNGTVVLRGQFPSVIFSKMSFYS
ncbi:unnamed protein product [Porites evermanni]|uniref:PHR domain-containing protein n=1 Tax=Porites evermanni TaxID=104178 RepID=A0ABN8MPT7_9CNID|nr:unnamed protein product [Porites evermanni]